MWVCVCVCTRLARAGRLCEFIQFSGCHRRGFGAQTDQKTHSEQLCLHRCLLWPSTTSHTHINSCTHTLTHTEVGKSPNARTEIHCTFGENGSRRHFQLLLLSPIISATTDSLAVSNIISAITSLRKMSAFISALKIAGKYCFFLLALDTEDWWFSLCVLPLIVLFCFPKAINWRITAAIDKNLEDFLCSVLLLASADRVKYWIVKWTDLALLIRRMHLNQPDQNASTEEYDEYPQPQ